MYLYIGRLKRYIFQNLRRKNSVLESVFNKPAGVDSVEFIDSGTNSIDLQLCWKKTYAKGKFLMNTSKLSQAFQNGLTRAPVLAKLRAAHHRANKNHKLFTILFLRLLFLGTYCEKPVDAFFYSRITVYALQGSSLKSWQGSCSRNRWEGDKETVTDEKLQVIDFDFDHHVHKKAHLINLQATYFMN